MYIIPEPMIPVDNRRAEVYCMRCSERQTPRNYARRASELSRLGREAVAAATSESLLSATLHNQVSLISQNSGANDGRYSRLNVLAGVSLCGPGDCRWAGRSQSVARPGERCS